jgi:hypothetical protein
VSGVYEVRDRTVRSMVDNKQKNTWWGRWETCFCTFVYSDEKNAAMALSKFIGLEDYSIGPKAFEVSFFVVFDPTPFNTGPIFLTRI